MQLIEELAAQGKLLDPETRAPVRVVAGRVVSASGRDLGPVRGPLDFLPRHKETIKPRAVSPEDVARVRAQVGLEQSPEVDAEVARSIAATGAQFESDHLSAEARILAERLRMAAFATEPSGPSRAGQVLTSIGQALFGVPKDAVLRHVSSHVGARMTARHEIYRSVRVRNEGRETLAASQGRVQTRWKRADGTPVPECSLDTELPVDIEGGREITLILRIRVPPTMGPHLLEVVQVPGAGSALLSHPVEVIPTELPLFDYTYYPTRLEYPSEHHVGYLEAVEFLQQEYPGRSLSGLEIGGGMHPTAYAVAGHGHRFVCADISHSQSILGALYFHQKMPALDESLSFLSCEGTQLPFGDGAFDGVMMFSAFHHFEDPLALLAEAKRVTRPDGFIFIGCETCAPDPADGDYRDELRRGINEQMWTLAEFEGFFRASGLRPVRARIDYHQLKVGLRKA